MKIVDRLRNYDTCNDSDVDIAADMLEFFFNCMQSHSLHMDGTAAYRFHGGWPLTSARGNGKEEVVMQCLKMIKEEKSNEDQS